MQEIWEKDFGLGRDRVWRGLSRRFNKFEIKKDLDLMQFNAVNKWELTIKLQENVVIPSFVLSVCPLVGFLFHPLIRLLLFFDWM